MKTTPDPLHDILRSLLRESMRLAAEGGGRARLDHARGYADGFMRALIDSRRSDRETLLQIVREVRAESFGPATRESLADSVAA